MQHRVPPVHPSPCCYTIYRDFCPFCITWGSPTSGRPPGKGDWKQPKVTASSPCKKGLVPKGSLVASSQLEASCKRAQRCSPPENHGAHQSQNKSYPENLSLY